MTNPVLINGQWTASTGSQNFHAMNPSTREEIPREFPLSPWEEIDQALDAAAAVSRTMRNWPGSRFADFLDAYASEIEARTDALVAAAHEETVHEHRNEGCPNEIGVRAPERGAGGVGLGWKAKGNSKGLRPCRRPHIIYGKIR